jgi:hypothetical protein
LPSPKHTSIDFTAISFPSDRLTFKDLRALDSKQDAQSDPGTFSKNSDFFDTMRYLERLLAFLAFETACGRAKAAKKEIAAGDIGIKGMAKDLSEFYIRYGLATGPAAAEELIKSVRAEGEKQAIQLGGRPV